MDQSPAQRSWMSPAAYVIKVFGGVRPLARLLTNYAPSQVSRWRSGKGLVPSEAQKRLLALAAERELDLTAEDLVRGRELAPSEG